MFLASLSLLNFKNYEEAQLDFSPGLNIFTGKNGAGKTNLLDAVHYLSLCKSYFNPIDIQQIRTGADFFMINGVFQQAEMVDHVTCSIKKNQKKQFKRNKKEYTRLADHIGLFPLVMLSPYDVYLVTGLSEDRRRFLDNVMAQIDIQYLDQLIFYNKILLNRNLLLKQSAQTGYLDGALLDIYTQQLLASGQLIFERRQAFMAAFVPIFQAQYNQLTDHAEQPELIYTSQLAKQSFASLLQEAAEKDKLLERTTVGIHKDDLIFELAGMPIKKFGSQGQQKSFLIALKLAQHAYIRSLKSFGPILLLDDIFDKLDNFRVHKLMKIVSEPDFGQVFITDTDLQRTKALLPEGLEQVNYFKISQGTIEA